MSNQVAVDPLFLSFQLAVAGRYSLDREIGRGGMGIVYLAREVRLDRSVAIKLLPPERAADHTLRDRFLREARLASQLSHPSIIPIHAVEETEGFVYFVMAYVDGETLAHRVRTRGPLPPNEGARVLREVAWALAHAHERGLIHRDVKPDNILLEGTTGRVLVADFGIAAAFGDSTEDITGTPEFMSPEQCLGTQLDARSDLYGLGATAFYAFSGRFPFEGRSATEVLGKQVSEPAPPLASLGVTVPRKVAALIDRCLAKSPDQRPESAQAMAEQLNVALELRKELPAALRAFVKRGARMSGPGALFGWMGISFAAVGFAALTDVIPGFLAFGAMAAGLPFAYMTLAARRVLKLGFAHGDLDPAFKSEAERTREELSYEKKVTPLAIEKYLPGIAKFSWPVYVATFAGAIAVPSVYSPLLRTIPGVYQAVVYAMLASGWVAIGSTILLIALRQRHSDADNEWWAKVWGGRIGRAAFHLASKLLKPGERQTAVTHRATELSLGMAADQLYQSLPRETRDALADVPAMLTSLQADAQALRKHLESLNDAIAEAGDAATGSEYAEVREMRDSLQSRLADTVGALETIRLNLLRLHAGTLNVESVTTHLGIAAEVSAGVKQLIAAHADVAQMLRFPRTPESTPV